MPEDNTCQIRLGCVSLTALVQRERAATRTTGPRVTDNSFELHLLRRPDHFNSCNLPSQASQIYDATEHEDPETPIDPESQEEAYQDGSLESYPGRPYDTSLLYNYAKHGTRHV